MSKNNTALMELLNEINKFIPIYRYDSRENYILNSLKSIAIELLEKEKSQIVYAFTAGQIDIAKTVFVEYKKRGLEDNIDISENDNEDGANYFNKTYNT